MYVRSYCSPLWATIAVLEIQGLLLERIVVVLPLFVPSFFLGWVSSLWVLTFLISFVGMFWLGVRCCIAGMLVWEMWLELSIVILNMFWLHNTTQPQDSMTRSLSLLSVPCLDIHSTTYLQTFCRQESNLYAVSSYHAILGSSHSLSDLSASGNPCTVLLVQMNVVASDPHSCYLFSTNLT